jgi:tetratricopeptide (TPR) repeat protein
MEQPFVEYASLRLAEGLFGQGGFATATNVVLDLARQIPGPPRQQHLNNLAVALTKEAQYAEADRCLDAALRMDEPCADAWYNKGWLLTLQGQFRQSIPWYENALRINPRFVSAWLNKAVCLQHLGDHDAALDCCEEALRIDPRKEKALLLRDALIEARAARHRPQGEQVRGHRIEVGGITILYDGPLHGIVVTPEVFQTGNIVLNLKECKPGSIFHVDEDGNVSIVR